MYILIYILFYFFNGFSSFSYFYLHDTPIGNKINVIGNKYAISSEGIADASQNSSAALVMANNDLDEAIGLLLVIKFSNQQRKWVVH